MVRERIFKVRVETNYGQRHLQGVLQKRRSQVKWPLVFRSRSELISRLCRVLHELAPAFLSSSTFIHSSCSFLWSTPLSCLLSPTQTPTLWTSLWLRLRNVSAFVLSLFPAWVLLMSHAPDLPLPPLHATHSWDHTFLPDSGLGHPLSDLCAPQTLQRSSLLRAHSLLG